MIPNFTAADFLRALQALLPRGRAWPTDADAVQTQTLTGVAAEFANVANRGGDLILDAFPASTDELLPEWEASLGLPDPCQGEAPDLADRRAQVVARFAGGFAPSVPDFINYAATLGYTVTIIEFAPFRFGINHFGDPMYGVAWANAWTVRSPTIMPSFFQFGLSAFGDYFAQWGNTVLQCEFGRLKPAHTVVNFQYS